MRRSRKRKWENEEIIEAINDFFEKRGRQPSANDWKYKSADDYPTTVTVIRAFGSWSKAIEAAGFPPRTNNGTFSGDRLIYELFGGGRAHQRS